MFISFHTRFGALRAPRESQRDVGLPNVPQGHDTPELAFSGARVPQDTRLGERSLLL